MPEPVQNTKQSSNIKINLIPPRDNKESGTGKIFNWLLNGGRYLLIITELLLFSAFASRFYFDDTIQHQIEVGIQPRIATIDYLEKNQTDFLSLQSRLANVKLSLPTGELNSAILGEMLRLAPEGMLIETLNIGGGQMRFSGSVVSINQLEAFRRSLADSPVFRLLDVEELTKSGQDGVIRFKANTQIRKYKPIATQSATFSKQTL